MKVGKQARRVGRVLFRGCLREGRLDEGRVRGVVGAVLAGRPRGYLGVLEHFLRLVRLEVARGTARVESAVGLTAELEGEVRAGLERVYGGGLVVVFSEDVGLLGGLRVQVGCDVYDGSVRARLRGLGGVFGVG